ncbi:MAG: hypothetical protein AAF456_17360 [Planctomycetota bacterium]
MISSPVSKPRRLAGNCFALRQVATGIFYSADRAEAGNPIERTHEWLEGCHDAMEVRNHRRE